MEYPCNGNHSASFSNYHPVKSFLKLKGFCVEISVILYFYCLIKLQFNPESFGVCIKDEVSFSRYHFFQFFATENGFMLSVSFTEGRA